MAVQYPELEQAIFDGNMEAGVAQALRLVAAGKKPIEIFTECIEPVLAEIGEKFSRLEIFLPEMVSSADVVKSIQQALRPYLDTTQPAMSKGKIVIATVSGDLHDIGKNIVKAMLEVNGFEVKDLGVDVSAQTIIRTANEIEADIIALSALMLPSLPYVKDVIEFINPRDKFKVIVGGGTVTQEWADAAGADAYGRNAMDAVTIAKKLLE